MKQKVYHHLSIEQILENLKTQKYGLSSNEATLRLEKFGLNKFPEEKRKKYLRGEI